MISHQYHNWGDHYLPPTRLSVIHYRKGKLLTNNPFYLLSVSMEDKTENIRRMAAKQAVDLPEDMCHTAERILLDPVKRIDAELSYFPSLSLWKRNMLLTEIYFGVDKETTNYPQISKYIENECCLTRANAIAMFLNWCVNYKRLDNGLVGDLCLAASEITSSSVIQIINKNRALSGFPLVTESDVLNNKIKALKNYYQKTLSSFFARQKDMSYLASIYDECSCSGIVISSSLLKDAISEYETKADLYIMEKEEEIKKDLKYSSDFSASIESTDIISIGKAIKEWSKFYAAYQSFYHKNRHVFIESTTQQIRYLAFLSCSPESLCVECFRYYLLGTPFVKGQLLNGTDSFLEEYKEKSISALVKCAESFSKQQQLHEKTAMTALVGFVEQSLPLIKQEKNHEWGCFYLIAFVTDSINSYMEACKNYYRALKAIKAIMKLYPEMFEMVFLDKKTSNRYYECVNALNDFKKNKKRNTEGVKAFLVLSLVFGIVGFLSISGTVLRHLFGFCIGFSIPPISAFFRYLFSDDRTKYEVRTEICELIDELKKRF